MKSIIRRTEQIRLRKTGKKYKEPILLEKEGTTEIRAIVVNMKGIPSGVISQTYTIEFPIADAPAVTPSTGRYTDPQKITITVPDGYTAYYTTDGSEPTASSEKYTGTDPYAGEYNDYI